MGESVRVTHWSENEPPTREELWQRMVAEGLSPYSWSNGPHDVYAEHTHGYDKVMGARPMARLIQDKIKKALAEELLFGKLEHGGHVIVMEEDDDLKIHIVEEEIEGAVS